MCIPYKPRSKCMLYHKSRSSRLLVRKELVLWFKKLPTQNKNGRQKHPISPKKFLAVFRGGPEERDRGKEKEKNRGDGKR